MTSDSPDEEYDDDAGYEDDGEYEYVEDDLEELVKPEPMAFPDAYAAAGLKPVELVAPRHSDAFKALSETKDRKFPAKKVARSAAALAEALKKLSK